jgi:hypothetical protein
MNDTTYVGMRYVPVFAEPSQWDNSRQYENLMMVTNEGETYISKEFVPTGVELTNEDYWVKISVPSGEGSGGGGINYSTEEQDTGLKWIDGKPIYQKTISKNNTTYGNATRIDANVPDMDKLIDHKCTFFFPDAQEAPPLTDNGQAIQVMHLGGGRIMLGRNGLSIPADSTRTWHLTLYYTKTTDTPNS